MLIEFTELLVNPSEISFIMSLHKKALPFGFCDFF